MTPCRPLPSSRPPLEGITPTEAHRIPTQLRKTAVTDGTFADTLQGRRQKPTLPPVPPGIVVTIGSVTRFEKRRRQAKMGGAAEAQGPAKGELSSG
jgi:hypothetical protein